MMGPTIPNEKPAKMIGLSALVLVAFAILIFRLFYLQVTTSEDYARESDENHIAQKRIKAPRGLIYDRDGKVLVRNRLSYTIFLIRSTRQNDTRAVAALQQATGYPEISLNRKLRSIPLKRDVDFRTVSIVEERLRDEWPLGIEIELQRSYPFNSTASHLLGYLGELQEEDKGWARERNYVPGDFVGKTGIEKVYEDHLRGKDGVRFIEVDAKYRIRKEFPGRGQPAQPGRDLQLTIDLDVQKAAETALPDTLAGSVVALDPQTGAIIALASKPSFDPNDFVSFQAQRERSQVLRNRAKPLLNRSISGNYPPGSTLKMVTSIAALETGMINGRRTFKNCTGALKVGDVIFRCFKRDGHGKVNLMEATETSCNIYFQQLAQAMSIETWREYATKLGFGHPTGILLDPKENSGLLPSRQYHREREGWSQGHLLNLAIGQGAMLVTPIQMARYAAALGNGGYLVTPFVSGTPPPPRPIQGVSARTFETVRRSMLRVIHGERGTGRKVRIDGLEIAGKSGTAEGPRSDSDAWFVAFAPFDKPTIAVAVVVEGGGGGGSVAGPVARKVMEAFFEDRLAVPGPVDHLPPEVRESGWAPR